MMRPHFEPARLLGAYIAPVEAQLPTGKCTHYFLCNRTERLLLPNLHLLRAHLADLAVALCDGRELPEADTSRLVIQPVLVACLKNCYGDFPFRRRLAFDLDGDEESTLPPPQFVRAQFVQWLTDVFPAIDWAHARCFIFAGSFADKPASVHVYFPDYCFDGSAHNSFRQQLTLIARLSARFAEYNLTIDESISTGGLKLPFMDKWLKQPPRYRNASQQLVFATEPLDTFLDLYTLCDPLVCVDDAAYNQIIDFPAAAPPQRIVRARIENAPIVQARVQPLVGIDNVLQRLYEAVPQWNGVPVQRKPARDGLELLVPQHSYCPFKTTAHNGTGVCYVLLRNDHTLVIKCHKNKCANRVIEVTNPALQDNVHREVIERFNRRFACLQAGQIAQLPQRLDNGNRSELTTMTLKQFVEQESRHGEKFDKAYFPLWWARHELARRHEFGLICAPGGADRRYLNTWLGIRGDIAEIAGTLRDTPVAELRLLCPHWLQLVESNICDNNPEVIDYIFNWFAHCVQQPHVKPGVALVLLGPGGCGKGLTANALVEIYGNPHGRSINASDMRGNFNSLYSDACVMFVDEVEKVRATYFDNSKWKSLVTEPTGTHSEKYVKERTVQMFQHIIMASNKPKMVPMQDNERRYFVQQCGYKLFAEPSDPAYLRFCSAVAHEVYESPTALAAIYMLLMRRDLSNFVPQVHPFTKAMWHARYLAMPKPKRFVYRVLCSGNITLRDLTLAPEIKAQYESLCSDWTEQGNPGVNAVELGFDVFSRPGLWYPKDLWELGFAQHFPNSKLNVAVLWRDVLHPLCTWTFERKRVVDNTARCYAFLMPPQDELRQRFEQSCGNVDANIWNAEWMIE